MTNTCVRISRSLTSSPLVLVSATVILFLSTSGNAQQFGNTPGPPDAPMVDENFVQIPSDHVSVSVPQLSVGGADGLQQILSNAPVGAGAITLNTNSCNNCREADLRSGFYPSSTFESSLEGGISYDESYTPPTGASYTFSYGGVSERFSAFYGEIGSTVSNSGGVIVINPDNTSYTYTDRNGVKYLIDKQMVATGTRILWPVTRITYPNGRIVDINYRRDTLSSGQAVRRLRQVSSNDGWFVRFEYGTNATFSTADATSWLWINRVVGGNGTVDFCAPTSDTCILSQPRSATVNWSTDYRSVTVGDASGQSATFTQNQYYEIIAIRPFGSDINTISYTYCSRTESGLCSYFRSSINDPTGLGIPGVGSGFVIFPGMVYQAVQNGQTTQYSSTWYPHWTVMYTSYTNTYRGQRVLSQTGDPYNYYRNGSLGSLVLPDGTRYNYSGNADNRLMSVTQPSGSSISYGYDARGNVTTITHIPITGSGDSNFVTSSVYTAICTNLVVCNKPTSTTDARGNITDFTYDPIHGGVLTETQPADVNGVRPQKRYTYVQRYPWLRNAVGALVRSSSPIWVVNTVDECRSTAAVGSGCAGGEPDRIVTTYEYGPDAGPNNLLLRGIAITADGQTLRTCYGYNTFGDRISETLPQANLTVCP